MRTAYSTIRSATRATTTSRAGENNTKKKTLAREQLYGIIEGLTDAQANLLLMQAKSLSVNGQLGSVESTSIQSLSKRELEVLVLVANGYNRKSIGASLGISVNTAARHIANIYSKLGISTVAEATSLAYNCNVIDSVQGTQSNFVSLQ